MIEFSATLDEDLHCGTTLSKLEGSDLNSLPASICLYVTSFELPEFYLSRNGKFFTIESEIPLSEVISNTETEKLKLELNSFLQTHSIIGGGEIRNDTKGFIVDWTVVQEGPLTLENLIATVRKITHGLTAVISNFK